MPFSIASRQGQELKISWQDGKGVFEQKTMPRPYTVTAWIPATHKFI